MNDKVQHCIVGFILSGMGIFFLPFILLGFIFGIGKELYDWRGNGTVDINDMWATFMGASLAGIMVLLL